MYAFVLFAVVNMHIFGIKTLSNFASTFCHFTLKILISFFITARRGGAEVAGWTLDRKIRSIPRLPSPRVGPLMTRR